MTRITVHLSDDLHDAAKLADLAVDEICRDALTEALNAHQRIDIPAAPVRESVEADDKKRFQHGVELGIGWARRAPQAEVDEINCWSGLRWRQFRVDPESNSLPAAICRHEDRELPGAGTEFWIERSAFTVGILEGVAAACGGRVSALV